MRKEHDIQGLCDHIRQIAYDLHAVLRHGHVEKGYEQGMVNRMRRAGLLVEQQYPLKVFERTERYGEIFTGLFVANRIEGLQGGGT